ncbi:MAG: FAD-binding oxidoreductase [Candidatus Nanopelagicales bacterium]
MTAPTLAPEVSEAAEIAARTVREWPRGEPIRLAKRTSNLFRSRAEVTQRLDLSPFTGVFSIDPVARTAVVGGLTTYEDLVDATLPHGLVPLCVPQLRTITLGGAVTGLGIEAASFRNGLPHESVRSMEVLTGAGEVVRATPDGPHRDLFHGFANSYGTLGYALLIEIDLEPVTPQMVLRHTPFGNSQDISRAITEIVASRSLDGDRVDYVDGTVFSGGEMYLTTARYVEDVAECSDYTGMEIYYRSIQRRRTDRLSTLDYLWRWDTDWFWCSRAMGVQKPAIRRLWPKSKLRSDVYWRIVAYERRHNIMNRIAQRRHRPLREAVVQDVEVPIDALADFLEFFHRDVGIEPVWVCPLRQRDPHAVWPLYQFDPTTTYVNVGFWSSVELPPGVDPAAGCVNRAIERTVTELGGRKSLYSTSYYDRDEFYDIYGGAAYRGLKDRYDPERRLLDLYDKCVRSS